MTDDSALFRDMPIVFVPPVDSQRLPTLVTHGSMTRTLSPNHGASRPGVTLLGLTMFIVGAAMAFKLNFVGELYLGEALLPVIGLGALFFNNSLGILGRRAFVAMLFALFVMLTGYMVADLINDSRPDQYWRGWGRVFLVASDFVAFYILFSKDRRYLWWLTLGMGVGSIAQLFLEHIPFSQWKIGYAEPTMLVLLAMSCFVPGRLKALPLFGLGVVSMVLDYRSFAVIALALGGYLWLVSGRRGLPSFSMRTLITFSIVAIAVLTTAYFLLNSTSDSATSDRRAQSNAGREAAVEVGFAAIARSPIIGWGSWPEDGEMARLQHKLEREKTRDLREINSGGGRGGNGFGPHNQILNAWVEGGVLAAAFFFYLLLCTVREGYWIALRRQPDLLSPILVFYIWNTAWGVLMSPFAGEHRITIAIGAAILVLSQIERRRSKRAVFKQTWESCQLAAARGGKRSALSLGAGNG